MTTVKNLRKAARQAREALNAGAPHLLYLNRATGELWCNEYSSTNGWTDYDDPAVYCLSRDMYGDYTERAIKELAVQAIEAYEEEQAAAHARNPYQLRGIRENRLAAGLTQTELADAVGIPYRTIQKYENGEADPANMTLSLALRLAEALNIEPADLIE